MFLSVAHYDSVVQELHKNCCRTDDQSEQTRIHDQSEQNTNLKEVRSLCDEIKSGLSAEATKQLKLGKLWYTFKNLQFILIETVFLYPMAVKMSPISLRQPMSFLFGSLSPTSTHSIYVMATGKVVC